MPTPHHDDPFDDPFEGRLGAALRQTGDTFDTDRPALIAAGQARGRRLRLRRRAAVFGGVASIALVGVTGALVLPGNGTDGSGTSQQSVGRNGSPAPASSTPAPVSGDELLKTLKKYLPDGEFSAESARGTNELPGPYAHLVYDDGKGPAAIGVSLSRVEPGSDQAREATTCPDKTFVPYDSCRTTRLGDGSLLMIFQGYEYPDRRVDTKHWHAELVTPEGQQVGVSEWNSAAEKDKPISRDEPPLSPAQLKKVVTAPEWRGAVDAIPENPKGGAPVPEAPTPPEGPEVADIVTTLTELLPDGVEVVDKGSSYSYVVLDDGKGRSLVQVDVQPGMSDIEAEIFGSEAETLEDGTKVVTREGSGDKGVDGVVMWTADTLRKDGLRVAVSAFNAADQHSAATRETPALTMEQLREIALSPKWADLL
ncbi:hypothetical protein ACFV7R_14380 [Streptomyces sp. NPDC059866]|uniref:hypothetical protein n=1 Tax=Streptomyces sp. NPDC059866 TaxID=3346978 RepID=UPI003646B88D